MVNQPTKHLICLLIPPPKPNPNEFNSRFDWLTCYKSWMAGKRAQHNLYRTITQDEQHTCKIGPIVSLISFNQVSFCREDVLRVKSFLFVCLICLHYFQTERENIFVTLSYFHRKSLQLASLLKSIEFETMNEWRETKK